MTEKQFEEKVKAFLKKEGCWVLKTWSNGVQREGIPDLLVCCNGYFLGIELKVGNNQPSELQKKNISDIIYAGGIGMALWPEAFEDFKRLILRLKRLKGIKNESV